MEKPGYLRVADSLREPILNGELPPGARLPSRAQLSRRYSVSDQVARCALRLLVSEGLIEGRAGSGYYVRAPSMEFLLSRTDHIPGLDPLRTERLGARTETASAAMAQRLGVRAGEPLYQTECLGYAKGTPIALHIAWEPALLTLNTGRAPGELPAFSVADRLAEAGIAVDRIEEEVSVRGLREPEARRLALRPGASTLVVQRTHFAGQRPVETSDLIVSADHCRLGYRLAPPRRDG
ncbi:GntR family transcriptional regulator [Thermobifida halotolerans]|uniref:GntR family transcriptional regulator n=1 Tax=Thermobifida halotolerans TaxID=483545 RepID=A0A399FV26_9ACTN|nr:GntR family transcriptional regulator [Thermobifida halotolerans]UOE19071.1 GntR family transcriptional regulator [Thermobifida halotolerans]